LEKNKEKHDTHHDTVVDAFEEEKEGKKLRQYTPLKTPEPELEPREITQV